VRRIRVYVDTSVFGGIRDDEFADASRRFFDCVHEGQFIVMLSAETLAELARSPESVQAVWRALPPDQVEECTLDAEVRDLAAEYIRANVLGEASFSDALHVAAATVAGATGQ
jgi:predicted nucleic acid-binding protein